MKISKLRYKVSSFRNFCTYSEILLRNIPDFEQSNVFNQISNYSGPKIQSELINAFYQRRRITKDDVCHKIEVIDTKIPYKTIILSEISEFFRLSFSSRMVIHKKGIMDSNFIKNHFFQENEYTLFNSLQNKLILNGFVPHLEEYDNYKTLENESKKIVDIFFHGEKRTNLEKLIEIQYLHLKLLNKRMKLKYNMEDNTVFTDEDAKKLFGYKEVSLNISKIKFNEDLSKNSKFFTENYLLNYLQNEKLLHYFGLGKKKFDFFTLDNSLVEIKLLGFLFLRYIHHYLDSQQFAVFLDTNLDFYINHYVTCLHIWFITERLSNFRKSKKAIDLKREIWNEFINLMKNNWLEVDTLKKNKKMKTLEENCKELLEVLTWHFKIQNNTVENPFYKIDALVWQYIFRKRINRYDERVFKLSAYIIDNYKYLQSLNLEQILNFDFCFKTYGDTRKFMNIFKKYNKILSEDEFHNEMFSKLEIKSYEYYHLNENDREDKNMLKTYVRYTILEDLNGLSNQQIDEKLSNYDEINDVNIEKKIQEKFENELNAKSRLQFNFWKHGIMKKLFSKIDKDEIMRKNKQVNEISTIPRTNIERFSMRLKSPLKEKILKYRFSLDNNKNVFKENYLLYDERILLSPELNISNKYKKRKPLADRLFNL